MGLSPGLVDQLRRPGAGLLLDLDGTLVDSEPVHRAAFESFFAAQGWQVSDDVVRQFSGRRAQEVFATLAGPWTGLDPDELTEQVIAVLRDSDPQPPAVPGAADLLAACAAVGMPVAVVTSARREWAQPAVAQLVAGGKVPPMVTAEDCTHGKPDAEPYRRGAAVLGLDPAGLVAVEDAPAGIASAHAAGVGYVVGLTTSHGADALTGADLAPGARADEVRDDLRALARAVADVGLPQR